MTRQQVKKMLKLVTLVLGASFLLVACSGPQSIVKEIEVEFSGYNGDGIGSLNHDVIDQTIYEISLLEAGINKTDAQAVAQGDELVYARLDADPQTSGKLRQAELLAESVDYSLDKEDGLSNGDQVVLTIETSSKESPVKAETKAFTVTGLKDYKTVAITDIIDIEQLSVTGFDGYGRLNLKQDWVDKVEASTDSQSLRNGDKITLMVTDSYKEELKSQGQVVSKTSLEYDVKGLKNLTDISNLSDSLAKNDSYIKSEFKNNRHNTYTLEPQKHFIRYAYGNDESAKGRVELITVYKITDKFSLLDNTTTDVYYKYYGYKSFVRQDNSLDLDAADKVTDGSWSRSEDYEGLLAELETKGYKEYKGITTSEEATEQSTTDVSSTVNETDSQSSEQVTEALKQKSSQVIDEDAKTVVDRLVSDYRVAINKAILSKDTSDLEKLFVSGSSTYRDVVDNILPQLWTEGLEAYDSTTTAIEIIEETDGRIVAKLTFDTVSRYKNGTSKGPLRNDRTYTIIREGDKWLIESFS